VDQDQRADTRGWVTEPLQARSQETLARFLEAADQLLREKPFEDITIAEIVEHADRTVGSFYARFADKEALLRTLAQRVLDQLIADMERRFDAEQWRAAPLEDVVRTAVRASVVHFWANAHIARAALTLAGRDDEARRSRTANYIAIGTAVRRAIDASDARIEASDGAVSYTVEVVAALLDTRALFAESWRPGREIDLEAEINSISDIALRLLQN
jgi:AcrR family transcriptional regulator